MWGVSYWVFPVISGLTWLGMLLGLLIHWTSTGKPHYAPMAANQRIAYISDVGAQSLKPLFIAGSCVTTIFLDLAFLSDVFLRHRGRLANLTGYGRIVSALSLVFAAVGTAGLILLSIFDTLRYHTLHDVFLLMFIAGYVISAVFICWEYQRLGTHFRQHRILRISFWIKLVFILLAVVLAIAFGCCNFKKLYNAAAVLEWAIAFIFTFYVFSFFMDLMPAVRTKHAAKGGETEMETEANDGLEARDNRGDGGEMGEIWEGRRMGDSRRALGRNDEPVVGAKHGRDANGSPALASNF